MNRDARQLKDLDGIGKAALEDFRLLGIRSIEELKIQNPDSLFEKLARISGPQDPCVLDVFRCAIAQANNPKLPKERRNWWYWSRLRKRSEK